jgi:hypothetical protein
LRLWSVSVVVSVVDKSQTPAAGGFVYKMYKAEQRRSQGCAAGVKARPPGTGSAAATGWPPQSVSAHGKDRLDVVAVG